MEDIIIFVSNAKYTSSGLDPQVLQNAKCVKSTVCGVSYVTSPVYGFAEGTASYRETIGHWKVSKQFFFTISEYAETL